MRLSLFAVMFLVQLSFFEINGYSIHLIKGRFQSNLAAKINKKENLEPKKPTEPDEKKSKGFTLSGLFQLVMMGAGAPVLGEYKGTDENGKMLFELEANNLVDSEGNSIQTKAPYFEKGYVGDRFDDKPPGFWSNLLSGGKLQSEWDKRNSNK